MRVSRLQLTAFGPFTGQTLDLPGKKSGLQIVYGPNESGKSSSLRALHALLFGIPHKSTDNFIHPYQNLRIEATLESADGKTLSVVRRKASKDSLRAEDDKTVIDEAVLRNMLGGVDEITFKTMFGLDRQTLVAGGTEICKGGGELGQILFSAGAGISELKSLCRELEETHRELFLPSGKKPINLALLDYKNVRKQLRDAELSVNEWLKHTKEFEQAIAHRVAFERRASKERGISKPFSENRKRAE